MRSQAMIGFAAVLLMASGCASHRAATSTGASGATAAAPSNGMTESSGTATAGSGTSTPGITEREARGWMEQDGYANVKNLHQTGDGGWTGQASAGGKPLTVTVKPDGSVVHQ